MAELKFVDLHNQAMSLTDPPSSQRVFQSMIDGLKQCCLFYAFETNPDKCSICIADFWKNATHNKEGEAIESTVRGTPMTVTEQTIREVLRFRDQPSFPTEYPADKVVPILTRMGYEGSYPSTKKKYLPPFWRFLFHSFNCCLSGKKGGIDEISKTGTSALIALTLDWEFNYSKMVFNEMVSNLDLKKKTKFLMYPRFVQMILSEKHPEIERSQESLDVKVLGTSSLNYMKQSISNQDQQSFKGLHPLEKFG